jgi:hypothetical protein
MERLLRVVKWRLIRSKSSCSIISSIDRILINEWIDYELTVPMLST